MNKMLTAPTDLYDPMWVEWNRQNPGVRKSVGAAAAEGGEGGEGETPTPTPTPTPAPAQTPTPKADETAALAQIQAQLAAANQALEVANAEKVAAAAALAAFDGVDADEAKRLLKEKKDAELAAAEARGEFDRVKAAMTEQHVVEIAAINTQLAEALNVNKSLQATIDELTVGRAFSDSQFINEELVLTPAKARKLYGEFFEIEGGQVVGYDKPKGAAERTPFVNAKGEKVGFEEALKRLIDADPDRDRMKRSKKIPGAGSGTSESAAPPVNTAELHGSSRIAAALLKQKKT